MARKNENRKVKQKFVSYATIEKEGIRRELRVANILTENGYKVSVPLEKKGDGVRSCNDTSFELVKRLWF